MSVCTAVIRWVPRRDQGTPSREVSRESASLLTSGPIRAPRCEKPPDCEGGVWFAAFPKHGRPEPALAELPEGLRCSQVMHGRAGPAGSRAGWLLCSPPALASPRRCCRQRCPEEGLRGALRTLTIWPSPAPLSNGLSPRGISAGSGRVSRIGRRQNGPQDGWLQLSLLL